MDKYEVIHVLGEGSFGRVYKAKQTADSKFVALKVISKRGKSTKELKGLRRECEIQKYLHHPNIIQMLDSFETENEIVVITEFAHKELNEILSKKGYLPENKVQEIVWDLVSALYYLHSHRVLHRDLKPQNILLDSKNCAKLCDFGFARNMSTGTHVLTSIKGTPLYMAPELIEELPYDHNADLWSLGCIIYELLVGAPPFCPTTILQLITLIKHRNIQWPTFTSENCMSFLKGLLQKNPSERMTWPEILNHPFVKGHILITEDTPTMPLTRPLSVNSLQVKEQQRKDHFTQKTLPRTKTNESKESGSYEENTAKISKTEHHSDDMRNSNTCENKEENICEKLKNLSFEKGIDARKSIEMDELKETATEAGDSTEIIKEDNFSSNKVQTIHLDEDSQPIESEEWIVFLLRSIKEIMNGELTSLCQPSLTNIIVSPLRNANATPKVLSYVANLFSLPFSIGGVSNSQIEQIKKVYIDVKLIPNLVYASKLLMREKMQGDESTNSTPSPTNESNLRALELFRSVNDLKEDELQALEYIYLLICHLVHLDVNFLNQFCDSVVLLNVLTLLRRFLLLSRKKIHIVIDLLAILTHMLKKCPESNELISRIILVHENDGLNFVDLLRHSNSLLRERTCFFLLFLSKHSSKTLESVWNNNIKDTLEALMYDSMENVRNAAEKTVDEMKIAKFLEESEKSDISCCDKSK